MKPISLIFLAIVFSIEAVENFKTQAHKVVLHHNIERDSITASLYFADRDITTLVEKHLKRNEYIGSAFYLIGSSLIHEAPRQDVVQFLKQKIDDFESKIRK